MRVRAVRFPLPLAAFLVVAPLARAADVTLATQDGLAIRLDAATGAVTAVSVDGFDATDRNVYGGPYVRDREHLLDVPGSAVNLFPNPSLEDDADNDQVPDGWRFEDTQFKGATMTWGGGAFAGRKCVTINDKDGGALLTDDVPVTPGQRYVIQAMTEGTATTVIYVVWKTSIGEFILYESGHGRSGTASYSPVHFVVTAPLSALKADIGIVMVEDGSVKLDLAQMYEAPPQTFSPVAGPVTATASGARQTVTLPALGLGYDATYTVKPDRIDLDVLLSDTRNQDRAIEAGFILPLYVDRFWDNLRTSRIVTQKDYSETFAYTSWGGMYNDGPWGWDRSVFPFAALSLFDGSGIAMGYDPAGGPQDVRFFHSTYFGESFTSLFRLGLAAEPARFPRQARYRTSFFRVDGAEAFRSALERTYKASGGGFDNRLPATGGWTPWRNPVDIPGPADFGIAAHTYDGDVAGDDAQGVLTFANMGSFDYWLPLGDFASAPTPTQARARIEQNAAQTADPGLQQDARSVKVSGLRDPAGEYVLDIYQASWMPGSGWAAVCGIDPDPQVSDTTGQGWSSRWALLKDDLDARIGRADTAGSRIDGALMDWFRSWHDRAYNHRREHWSTCDVSPSFDPETLSPALVEAFSHWDAAKSVSDEMHAAGRFLMARDIHIPSFWASPLFDAIGQEVNWQANPDGDETLSFYRAAAGKKPYMMLHDGDFAALDPLDILRPSLFYGLIPEPYYDVAQNKEFWDLPAEVDRFRPAWKLFMPLFRLEAASGWEPVTRAASDQDDVWIERWGSGTSGALLFSAINRGGAALPVTVSVDLAALGIVPGKVLRAVDLVGARGIASTLSGSTLALADTLAPGAVRLYHLHLAKSAGAPIVLKAVKRRGDVQLSWNAAGRSSFEVLSASAPQLAGAGVDVALTETPGFTHAAVAPQPPSLFYSVE